jgi:hypothetical protein
VQLPFDRLALARRNRLDEIDEAAQYAQEGPAERFQFALEASALARKLALAVGNNWETDTESDLRQKSALYVVPLRKLIR